MPAQLHSWEGWFRRSTSWQSAACACAPPRSVSLQDAEETGAADAALRLRDVPREPRRLPLPARSRRSGAAHAKLYWKFPARRESRASIPDDSGGMDEIPLLLLQQQSGSSGHFSLSQSEQDKSNGNKHGW